MERQLGMAVSDTPFLTPVRSVREKLGDQSRLF